MKPMPRVGPALRYVLIALLAAALLSACGFRQRGSVSLPEDFREIYIDGPVQIVDEIAVFLESGGASVVDARGEADAVIKVQSERYDQRVVSVDATSGKAREFELLYTLEFSVRMKDGTMLVLPEPVVVALRVDMRRDAAGRIIRITEAALGA
jgi:outer membrane lipopolysaccharide assembly protein LptE/RlpB